MSNSADTRCAAFWKHTNVRSNNEVFPCCRFKYPVQKFDGDLQSILHSSEYESLRKDSESGIKIDGCQKCYYEESIGTYSIRNFFNDNYSTEQVNLEFLEIGFDNICNLTCDGCSPYFSSSWAKKLNLEKIVKTTVEINHIPDTVNKILFLGGEPFMTSRHLKLLNKISDKQNVAVEYNTNGTFLLDDATIQELAQFKRVKITLSIDGYGELNDAVRQGSNWDSILRFIDQIKELNFELEINSVIHLNNWHGIVDLAEFNNSLNVIWYCRILTYPTHLDIVNLNEIQKQQLRSMLHTIEIPSKDNILRHINNTLIRDNIYLEEP